MNLKEMVRSNISSLGYRAYDSVKGKGLPVYTNSTFITGAWLIEPENRIEKIRKILDRAEKIGFDNLYIPSITIYDRKYKFETYKESLEVFNVENTLRNKSEDISDIEIYKKPKFLGYIPVSRYDATLESQQKMLSDVLFMDGRRIYGEEFYVEDEFCLEQFDDIVEFSNVNNTNCYMNGDYIHKHGGKVCDFTGEAEYINCRVSNYSDRVLDDFWNSTIADEDVFSFSDPDDKVSVYHRKGKDWYVGYSYNQDELEIAYRDEQGNEMSDIFVYLEYASDAKMIVEKLTKEVRLLLADVEIRGVIDIALNSDLQEDWMRNDYDIFNNFIFEKEGDDLAELGAEILNYTEWENLHGSDYVSLVKESYEKFLEENMEDDILLGKYKHLKMLKEIAEKEGKKVEKSSIYGSSSAYGIRYKKEVYHFSLKELFDSNPKDFYNTISKKLTDRLAEKEENKELIDSAKYVFVGLDDSYESGNCKLGTTAFCKTHNIDTSKIGGVRGDVLLEMDFSNYTRRAVSKALKREGEKNGK